MAIFKCKMCGGDLNIEPNLNVIECEYCGTTQTVPTVDNEKKINLFNRANRLRFNSEFDKAAGIYESIIAEFPEEAEAYWGLCLCNYGIEYVDDPATAKKVPTCHRASFEKLSDNENFNLAMEYADVIAQKVYRDEAREIERIMENILSISKDEKPYDVFICYKETDEKGGRTIDSVLAQDIYDALTSKGLKVFFARITLEDKLGQMYEPYIFAALNSAKVMLSVGTKYEHFHAVWVKNEWSRFLKLMAKDKSKILIPCYKDMDAYDLPDEFKALQAQDMGKIGFMQDLVRGIEKVVGVNSASNENTSTVSTQNSLVAPLVERAFIFLEDGKWESADEYCEKALDLEPKNAQAYLGKLLAEYKKHNIKELADCDKSLLDNDNFTKVKRYADVCLTENINALVKQIEQSLYEKDAGNKYNKAKKLSKIVSKNNLEKALSLYNEISGFSDADECADECKKLISIIEKSDELYKANKDIVSEKLSVIGKLNSEKSAALRINPIDASSITTPSETQREIIINKIGQLKAELNSLGFFKKKEKQALQDRINIEEKALLELNATIIKERNNIILEKTNALKAEAEKNVEKFNSLIAQAQEDLYQFGVELIEKTDYRNAKTVFTKLSGYKDSAEKLKNIPDIKNFDIDEISKKISIFYDNAISAVVDSEGKVVTAKTLDCTEDINTSLWSDIVSVFCNGEFENYDTKYSVFGIKSDHTVVCEGFYRNKNLLSSLSDIESIRESNDVLEFEKTDGTRCRIDKKGKIVPETYRELSKGVSFSYDSKNQIICNIGITAEGKLLQIKTVGDADREEYDISTELVYGFDFSDWDSVIDLAKGSNLKTEHSWVVGLKSDGTVVATGPHPKYYSGVENWKNVEKIFTTNNGTLGITSDGKMLATPGAFTVKQKPFLDKVNSLDLSKLENLNFNDFWIEDEHYRAADGFLLIYGLTDDGKIEYCLHRESDSSADVFSCIKCDNVLTIINNYRELIAVCDDGSLKYIFGPKDCAVESSVYKLIKENPGLMIF